MTQRVQVGGLQVAKVLYDFVGETAIPGTCVDAAGSGKLMPSCTSWHPRTKPACQARDDIQAKIDAYASGQATINAAEYKAFRRKLAICCRRGALPLPLPALSPELPPWRAPNWWCRYECALCLERGKRPLGFVVRCPCMAPMSFLEEGGDQGAGLQPVRGAKVIEFARNFLDEAARWLLAVTKDSTLYAVANGQLVVSKTAPRPAWPTPASSAAM